jgi:iron(III) transport system ATP-binding protein
VLRAIAGLELLDRGSIYLQGRMLSCAGFSLAPEQRELGMVFQDFALFPHLTVMENVAFGLHALKRNDRKARAREYLTRVRLEGVEKRYPHELSGGQQQRVALARALAVKPKLILLDEPFSSLDVYLRDQLALEVREILREAKATAILVTHDQLEAFAIADHVGVMEKGVLRQWGTPRILYEHPANGFVGDFVQRGMRRINPLLVA